MTIAVTSPAIVRATTSVAQYGTETTELSFTRSLTVVIPLAVGETLLGTVSPSLLTWDNSFAI